MHRGLKQPAVKQLTFDTGAAINGCVNKICTLLSPKDLLRRTVLVAFTAKQKEIFPES